MWWFLDLKGESCTTLEFTWFNLVLNLLSITHIGLLFSLLVKKGKGRNNFCRSKGGEGNGIRGPDAMKCYVLCICIYLSVDTVDSVNFM